MSGRAFGLDRLLKIFDRKTQTFDRYVDALPTHQNAIDAIPGWSTAFPEAFGVTAGIVPTYYDQRIFWAIDCFGALEGREVLELGPLEAGHTYMLENAGAQVDAVEANQLAFMRCLVAKEILGLRKARFWLGDFVKWLEQTDKSYDLIVASGVLYHQHDPLRLLELIAQRASAVFIWTHVVSEAMPVSDPRRSVMADVPEEHSFHGVVVRAYPRSYVKTQSNPAFCGGMRDDHRWLDKDDLIAALRALGFDDIRTNHDEPDHVYGPAVSIFARRS
ncbi:MULTISPECIES: bifunctional 2-polyprenyl-6-hydroxyphenol methylase/3-demethylubiquinol 3-O-methyltransferase UbiG [unclassified Methylosinus]|uniref:class I SAM-dependent methyltransferase n=1 Tax=unclassified Methylosinus TaxID=2624500 RepID=UPI00140D5A31|nr:MULTISPECIES: class I SAM-dependent methyltransferase [unclassified Methylosinus]MBU3890147.1 class I SAM-dependent methyltransferase [Methylosinus sp. KRF6]